MARGLRGGGGWKRWEKEAVHGDKNKQINKHEQ